MIRVAIYGYGNLGKGVELAVEKNPDMENAGIFTRRAPESVKTLLGTKVYSADDILSFKDKIDVLVFDPFLPDEKAAELGVTKVDLHTIFSECQIISNHLANNEQTRGMLDAECFNRMGKDATFINTGRGAQVDEDALCDFLESHPAACAVLDVTDPEPPVFENPLRNLKNVIFLPHIAGVVNNGLARIGRHIIKELELWEVGRPAIHEITEDIMFRIGKA